MKKYLLPQNGKFFKANLHSHSTFSDGALTPEEMKKAYMEQGYSIIAYTDHDLMFHHRELNDDDFLALSGFEIYANQEKKEGETYDDIKVCHICFVALRPDVEYQVCFHRTKYIEHNIPIWDKAAYDPSIPDFEREYTPECINEMMRLGRENGFFVTYNHPGWSLEGANEYLNYNGMHALEIINGGSYAAGFDDYSPRVYDEMLRSGKRIYCIAADDNHNHQPVDSPRYDSFKGFTMIKAEKLDHTLIGEALLNGDFYCSEGPLIDELWFEDNKVHITTPNACRITFNTGRRHASVVAQENDGPMHAEFSLWGEKDIYFRLTVTNSKGRHACTNAYFIDELNK